MSQNESQGYKPDLIGKRVRHNCQDPNCTLQGVILDIVPDPDKPLNEAPLQWRAVVKFDPHKGLPKDYTDALPLSEIRVVDDE